VSQSSPSQDFGDPLRCAWFRTIFRAEACSTIASNVPVVNVSIDSSVVHCTLISRSYCEHVDARPAARVVRSILVRTLTGAGFLWPECRCVTLEASGALTGLMLPRRLARLFLSDICDPPRRHLSAPLGRGDAFPPRCGCDRSFWFGTGESGDLR
jgi:hypothetical protein